MAINKNLRTKNTQHPLNFKPLQINFNKNMQNICFNKKELILN